MDPVTFGPVPSRRLQQSLGINNIPPKSCSYSCIYCQLGRTLDMRCERKTFFSPREVFEAVNNRIKAARDKNEQIDYLTFVSDGEPTLDINIGETIGKIKATGIKIAVITNASLMWQSSVREDLCGADWVSVKVDAGSEDIWKKTNRPHKSLCFEDILEGISIFSKMFKGVLTTETMMIKGFNDSIDNIKRIADYAATLKPSKSYVAIPTRPPAEKTAVIPEGDSINSAYQIFSEKGIDTECLMGYEGNTFVSTGETGDDILSITSVHPMKEEALKKVLARSGKSWGIVEDLIRLGKLEKVSYRHQNFFVRKIRK